MPRELRAALGKHNRNCSLSTRWMGEKPRLWARASGPRRPSAGQADASQCAACALILAGEGAHDTRPRFGPSWSIQDSLTILPGLLARYARIGGFWRFRGRMDQQPHSNEEGHR